MWEWKLCNSQMFYYRWIICDSIPQLCFTTQRIRSTNTLDIVRFHMRSRDIIDKWKSGNSNYKHEFLSYPNLYVLRTPHKNTNKQKTFITKSVWSKISKIYSLKYAFFLVSAYVILYGVYTWSLIQRQQTTTTKTMSISILNISIANLKVNQTESIEMSLFIQCNWMVS